MVRRLSGCLIAAVLILVSARAWAQPAGSIRGVVYDRDFDAPLSGVSVTLAETGASAETTDQGNYVLGELEPGVYTLIFAKDGFSRQVKSGVVVSPGQLTDADAWLVGDFTDMDEFVVQEVQLGGGTEAGLLELRIESPALLDSIGAEFISRAGASDAAEALRFVAGTSVRDGKFAVVRGLPDRFVSSQLNGVRLPSADSETRAVELDQFPSDVIESVQVSKTFTPDQQGDASGGAVNVLLKGIPDENVFTISVGTEINTQAVRNRDKFLSARDGGISNFFGRDKGRRGLIQGPFPRDFDSPVGVSPDSPPAEWDVALTAGGRHTFDNEVTVGGLLNLSYERDTTFSDKGRDESWWVRQGQNVFTPVQQGDPNGEFTTQLFDVTQATQSVQWSALAVLGLEMPGQSLDFVFLQTHDAQETATLAEDTRGKSIFFPGFDRNDPTGPGNASGERQQAPFVRTETLTYLERQTRSMQLHGEHELPLDGLGFTGLLETLKPVLDWTASLNSATADEPDKRSFASQWLAASFNPGLPPFLPPTNEPAVFLPLKPDANFTIGNFARTWEEITEDSTQFALNLKVPFTQWGGDQGFLKAGVFYDQVDRTFDQESFSNLNDNAPILEGEFEESASDAFAADNRPISNNAPARVDVDSVGDQTISAAYWMLELPLSSVFSVTGGFRYEKTKISIVNDPEEDATFLPPGQIVPQQLVPGAADVDFRQTDLLPAVAFRFEPWEVLTLRGSYTQTVARQTFRELTPVFQQEFLGSDVFIGNPELQMSALDNFDLRLDYRPTPGSLFSVSWFHKDITDPIEIVQQTGFFTFSQPVNFPEGQMTGWEFEARQDLGELDRRLRGLEIGGNATLISSEVTLPAELRANLAGIGFPMRTRDMVNTPELLYNLFLNYEVEQTGTSIGVFYTFQGETLVAGAGVSSQGNLIPDVYAKEFGTLNVTVSQKLGRHFRLKFSAKNLTNPAIEEVFRSRFVGGDITKTSDRRGIDLSLSISASFEF